MIQPDVRQALVPVLDAFDDLRVPYCIGGSVASSGLGLPRATLDVDLVADVKASHASALHERLKEAYYVDELMILDAINRQASFNVIHLATIVKVDVFVLKRAPFDQSAFSRRRLQIVGAGQEALSVYMTSPEDIILHKLLWYRMGGMVSDRQWFDILGVMKVQGSLLDSDYLRQWANNLDLASLLERASSEAVGEG